MGGARRGGRNGYMKQRLVDSNAARLEAIERGEQIVVGVNAYRRDRASPLTGGDEADHDGVGGSRARTDRSGSKAWRAQRDAKAVAAALADAQARRDAAAATSCRRRSPAPRPASPPANGAGRLREVFGEYRAPTGVGSAMRNDAKASTTSAREVDRVSRKLGRRLTFLVGKPGLDGHSNGAEQIAVRARDAGMEVVYDGIRLTPDEIVDAAREKRAHVVGLSILSGSHMPLVRDVVSAAEGGRHRRRAGRGRRHHPAGGRGALKDAGVAAVYTPKDFELNRIMADLVRIVEDWRQRRRAIRQAQIPQEAIRMSAVSWPQRLSPMTPKMRYTGCGDLNASTAQRQR